MFMTSVIISTTAVAQWARGLGLYLGAVGPGIDSQPQRTAPTSKEVCWDVQVTSEGWRRWVFAKSAITRGFCTRFVSPWVGGFIGGRWLGHFTLGNFFGIALCYCFSEM